MTKRPGWFILLVAVLILWGLAGCASLYAHVVHGAEMAKQAGAWDEAFFASMPGWLNWDFAVATFTGLFGSIALLLRSKLARPLYIVSLVAIVIQFGYIFLTTDLIAHKGVLVAAGFPAFIFAMALVEIWVASLAEERGWVS